MGMNYFLNYKRVKPTDDGYDERYDDDEGLHVGKQSSGWQFLFQAYPSRDIFTAEDWHDQIKAYGLVDEEGKEVPLKEFVSMVKSTYNKKPHEDTADYVDPFGHGFSLKWFC